MKKQKFPKKTKKTSLELMTSCLNQNESELIYQIMFRDSEIEQLKNKIADLEESLNAKSIDGAKPI